MPLVNSPNPNVDRLKAKRDVRGLIKLLATQSDATTRQMAARALGQLRDPQAVQPLFTALHDSEAQVRKDAAWALGQLGSFQAVQPLIATLKDKDTEVHNAAAWALGQIGDPEAIVPLIDALKHWEEDVREAAFWSLGQIGSNLRDDTHRMQMIDYLTQMLLDEHPPMRQTAAATLDQVGWKPGKDTASAAYWFAKGDLAQCAALGGPAVPPLIIALQDTHKEWRQAAFIELVNIGLPAVESLVELLGSPDMELRQVAFWALLKIGTPAIESLIMVVQHEYEIDQVAISESAVRLLGNLGDERAVQPLVDALNAQHWSVRDAAMAALLKLGKPAIPTIVDRLNSPSDDVRWRLAHVLEQLGWEPTQDELGAIYWIAREQWTRCLTLGPHALKPLATAMHHWDNDKRKKAAWVLIQLAPHSLPLLIAALKEQAPPVQATAAWALGQLGDPQAVPALSAALQENAHEVRLAAIGALIRLHAPGNVLIQALQNEDMLVRKAAAWALGQSHEPHRVESLIPALQDPEADVREIVARALGEIGDQRALPSLLALINDPDPGVRTAIAEATERIYELHGKHQPATR